MKIFIRFNNYLIFISLLLHISLIYSQEVLVEDVNVGNHMDPTDPVSECCFMHYWDTLANHGAEVHFISQEGWNIINEMDLLCLIHLWGELYDDSIFYKITNFNKTGGNIFCLSMSDTHNTAPINVFNNLFSDTRWNTTMLITTRCDTPNWLGYWFDFSPFTDEFDPFPGAPVIIDCGNNAYPFIFTDSDYSQPSAAISYPFLRENICSSYVFLATGTNNWKAYISRLEIEDEEFATRILLTQIGETGYELEPCAVPEPFVIQVDSCPNCANPGDTITLTGNNLWQGSNENIGGDIEIYIGDTVVIPIGYSDYAPNCSTLTNTWLKFLCPELPDGNYSIKLGHKAILFDACEIQIPCETYEIQVDSVQDCANPGDTISILGRNLFPEIIAHVGDSMVTPCCYAMDSASLELICPSIPDGTYQVKLEREGIQYDAGEILIPCESPRTSCLAHPLPFSPNGDGINDYCKFEYPGMSEDNGVVSIYNLDNTLVREVRNGDVEFSSKGTITWDGKDSEGNAVNNGVYIYIIEADGRIVCNGTVYVAR